MLFSSIPFLYYFLPAVLITYFLAPWKMKNAVLLLFSLAFYGWGEPKLLFLMIFTIGVFYQCGLAIGSAGERRWKKFWLWVSAAVSLGLLGPFKYADFFISSVNAVTGLSLPLLKLALPVGISFYTFQCLSYTIDVYRGNAEVQKDPIAFGAYVTLFPQLIAGPIVRYVDVAKELENRSHSWENLSYGLRRFLVGLGKKVILADNFALLIKLFRESREPSVLFYWMYAVAFLLNIYFDFSGYSDMAIGLGRIFGFHFLENFNYPYLSKSITEFWRRWHMSLGSWFRDYVYIPMGGNRVSHGRWIFNIFTVWMLTGAWHGAAWNFVVWGLYFFILLAAERAFLGKWLDKLPRVFGHLWTVVTVVFSFYIFVFDGSAPALEMPAALSYLGVLFGQGGAGFANAHLGFELVRNLPLLAICIVGMTPLPRRLYWRLYERHRLMDTVTVLLCALGLLLCTAYLVDSSYNPFLYFQF